MKYDLVCGRLMVEEQEWLIVNLLLPATLQFLMVFLTPPNYLLWYYLSLHWQVDAIGNFELDLFQVNA